jgi:hypothetical protein
MNNRIIRTMTLTALATGLMLHTARAASGVSGETAQVKKDSVDIRNDKKDIDNAERSLKGDKRKLKRDKREAGAAHEKREASDDSLAKSRKDGSDNHEVTRHEVALAKDKHTEAVKNSDVRADKREIGEDKADIKRDEKDLNKDKKDQDQNKSDLKREKKEAKEEAAQKQADNPGH